METHPILQDVTLYLGPRAAASATRSFDSLCFLSRSHNGAGLLYTYMHMGARAVCVGSASAVIQLSLLLASAVQHLKSRVHVRGGARSTAPDENIRTGLGLL
jgi:hypothetical protein